MKTNDAMGELSVGLRALRRDVVDWGYRLWREDAGANAALVERLCLLDGLVALLKAAKRLPAPQAGRIRAMYEREEEFYRFGSWRLIPFNEARRERLARIDADERYLYPWYEEWSAVPPDTLDMLVEHLAGQPVAGLSPGHCSLLAHEIEEDPRAAACLARHTLLNRFLYGNIACESIAHVTP